MVTLQALHEAAQSTILALKSKVTTLQSHIKSQSQTRRLPTIFPDIPASLTDILNNRKKLVQGHWLSVREECASECEQLASAWKEWETKVKCVEKNIGTTTAKFNASLAVLQLCQQQRPVGNGDIMKGFHHHHHQHGQGPRDAT